MIKIHGKIISLPYKKKGRKSKPMGTVLVSRGERIGQNITFSAPFDIIPFLKLRMLVCLYGDMDYEKNHIYVSEAEDISRDLTINDIETLTVLAPGLTSSSVQEAMSALELSRVGSLVNIVLEEKEKTANKLADRLGDEKAFYLIKLIEDVSKDRDRLNVYKLFNSACTALDFHHAAIATDTLHRRAARHETTVAQLIKEYPWILAQVFEDDGLIAGETIAKKLGKDFPVDCCRARIMAHLYRDARRGYAFTPLPHIYGDLGNDFNQDTINAAIRIYNGAEDKIALEKNKILNKRNGYFIPELKKYAEQLQKDLELEGMPPDKAKKYAKAILLPGIYWSEVKSAKKIAKILNTDGIKLDPIKVKIKMQEWAGNIKLDDRQLSIADHLSENKIISVIGKAGSGKTTAIKALIHALQEVLSQPVPVLAPTGTAAQRVGVEVNASFATIHRWAGIALGDDDLAIGTSEYDDHENSKKHPVIIVDEMSMATITVIHRLLHVSDPVARFIFVGDPGQLPPIGPGGVFQTIINLANNQKIKQIHTIELEGNYRTTHGVTANALRVRSGLPLDVSYEGITIIEAITEKAIIRKTVETVKNLFDQGYTWNDIAVLTSTRSKGVDTEQLNIAFKKEFGKQAIDDNLCFSIGDPIISIRNDYTDGYIPRGLSPARREIWAKIRGIREKDRPTIYNGTRGLITGYIPTEDGHDIIEVTYLILEGEVTSRYHYAEINHYIELAYATTVHKMQGGQASNIVYAGNTSIGRDMLYTILTRSTNKVWLIGPGEIWEKAVQICPARTRSKLKYRIEDELNIITSIQPRKFVHDLNNLSKY